MCDGRSSSPPSILARPKPGRVSSLSVGRAALGPGVITIDIRNIKVHDDTGIPAFQHFVPFRESFVKKKIRGI